MIAVEHGCTCNVKNMLVPGCLDTVILNLCHAAFLPRLFSHAHNKGARGLAGGLCPTSEHDETFLEPG